MDFGIMLGDHPTSVSPREHFDGILRQVEAAQRAGITYLLIGQHFLFPGGSRWLQPVPPLARLAGEVDANTRLATQIMISPLYHPVMLAEELATLDIVTGGRLDVGLGLGYMPKEYETFGVPYDERIPRFVEGIELMRQRRPGARRNEQLASGPGKLTLALGITRAMNGADLTKGPLTVHESDREKRVHVVTSQRIGIMHCADCPLGLQFALNAFVRWR